MHIQAAAFLAVQRAGAAAAEDGNLIAGFVDGAIAVDSFGDGESWTPGAGGGDELWSWAWAKAGEMAGIVPRGNNLQHPETVLAVGGEGKRAAGNHADLDVIQIVD